MSANPTKGVNLHEVRADVPDTEDGKRAFDLRLRALTWEQMLTANGVRRVVLVNEMMERDIPIEVRVNLAKLHQRVPDATELVVEGPNPLSVMPNSNYRPVTYRFTETWHELPAAVAFWFHQATEFFPELGATYTDDGYYRQRAEDGETVLNWRPVARPKVAGILEFRAPADKRAEGAQTPSGLLLTRFQIPTGVPTGIDLDSLPIEDSSDDADLLDQLAPPAVTAPITEIEPEVTIRRSPARRS